MPDVTGRGCTLTASASGRLAAAGHQVAGRWCRTRTGVARPRRSPPRCALAPRVSWSRSPHPVSGKRVRPRGNWPARNYLAPGMGAAQPPYSGSPGRIKIIKRPRRVTVTGPVRIPGLLRPDMRQCSRAAAPRLPVSQRLTIVIVYPDCARGYCRQYVPGDRRPACPRFGPEAAREPRATM